MKDRAGILVDSRNIDKHAINKLITDEYIRQTRGELPLFILGDTTIAYEYNGTDRRKVPLRLGMLGCVHYNGVAVSRNSELGLVVADLPAINKSLKKDDGSSPINLAVQGANRDMTDDYTSKQRIFVANGDVVNGFNNQTREWVGPDEAAIALVRDVLQSIATSLAIVEWRLSLHVDINLKPDGPTIRRISPLPRRIEPTGDRNFNRQARAMPRAEVAAMLALMQ